MQVLAGLMALVYPMGVPLAIYLMLRQIREQLNPPMRVGEDEISVIERLASSDLYRKIPISQFTLQLRPQFW